MFTFRSNGLPGRSYDFFKHMKETKEFCDVTFRVGEQSIAAHRIVIAAAIPYFRDTLSNKVPRREENEIAFPDIDPAVFECLLEFAYSCEIVITTENVKNLLYGACHLRIDEVREACYDFLTDQFRPENVLSIHDFAGELNCSELLKGIECYVRENFSQVSESEEFLNLPVSYLKELLVSDDLCVVSEEEVFEATMNWVKKNPEERKADLPDLLKSVRMPLLSAHYLKDIVAKENLIRLSFPCRDLLDEARDFHAFPEERSSFCSFSRKPRRSGEDFSVSASDNENCWYVLYGNYTYTVKYFHSGEGKWEIERSASFQYIDSSSVGIGNKLYLFRGCDTIEYDSLSKDVRFLGPAPSGRNFTGAAPLGSKIYICGGRKGDSSSNEVECYDPETNTWELISSMHHCRISPGVAALGKCIYVLGGMDNTDVHSSVEKYDSRTSKWRRLPSMLTKRSALGSATLGGRIYACGGKCSNKCISTAEVYDPVQNKWEFVSPMKTARQFLKLVPYAGELYAIGGEDDQRNSLNTIEIYDPKTDEWRLGNETDSGKFIWAAGVISLPVASRNSSGN